MMSRKLTVREKALLLVLALLLLCCGYYLLVQLPVAQAIDQAAADQEDAQTMMMVEQVKAAKLWEMKDTLAQLDAKPAGTVSEIAEYDNMQNVVRTLNAALAAADNYNLIFSPVSIEEHIARRTIDMTFTCGGYTAARDIISQLYASPYRCSITAMSLTAQGERDVPQLARDGVAVKLTITFFEYVN